MSELSNFAEQLTRESEALQAKMREGVIALASDLFARILRRTPYQTGYLVSGWTVSARGKGVSTRRRGTGATAASVAARLSRELRAVLERGKELAPAVTLTNTAPYSSFVHEKDGGPHLEDLVDLSIQEVNARRLEVR